MEIISKNKVCKKCFKTFLPLSKSHNYCHSCWYDSQRKCKSCGEVINKLPKYYNFCNVCFYTKIKTKQK